MATLYCRCKKKHRVWAEFWWKPEEGRHGWIFWDDDSQSETFKERVTRCPACGEQLRRKTLIAA